MTATTHEIDEIIDEQVVEPKRRVTFETALCTYVDIESLNNIFTVAASTPRYDRLDLFFLVDKGTAIYDEIYGITTGKPYSTEQLVELVRLRNKQFPEHGKIFVHDLRTEEPNHMLARMVGLCDAVNVHDYTDASMYPAAFRPVCDTNPKFDPIDRHPYIVWFNGKAYDTTMMTVYLNEALSHTVQGSNQSFEPASAATMRKHNDMLFSPAYKENMANYLRLSPIADGEKWNSTVNRIYRSMWSSGRHLDLQLLNEKAKRTALKRLSGMLGLQILESDRLSGPNAQVETLDDFYELMAYNCSDVLNLAPLMFNDQYGPNFDLKNSLLWTYPELVFDRSSTTGKPCEQVQFVRKDRLTIDSTSAQFVAKVLAPYEPLEDMEFVSFDYPAPEIAAEFNIPQRNVLQQIREFFYEHITDEKARVEFDEIYEYYKSIEGKNFNNSANYSKTFPQNEALELSAIRKRPNNIPYYNADGTPTSCYVNFSTGGIHGSEVNMALFAAERDHAHRLITAEEQRTAHAIEMVARVQAEFPDATAMRALCGKQVALDELGNEIVDAKGKPMMTAAQTYVDDKGETLKRSTKFIRLADGTFVEHALVLAPGSTIKNGCSYINPENLTPKKIKDVALFKPNPDGSTTFNKRYTYTTIAESSHQDFSSYYPNLLRNMRAFYNPQLGEDRYAKLYDQKEELGEKMKDPTLTPEQRQMLKSSRNGVKLMLNSASGAANARFENNIRLDNYIISMRLIGQMFTWMVAQAMALGGARVPSTNTDGIYVTGMDEALMLKTLEEMSDIIRVKIEPEPVLLVSKDSNNRLELSTLKPGQAPWETEVLGASGSALASYAGPSPDRSIAHPALTDYVLVEYLRAVATGYTPPWSSAPLSLDEDMDTQVVRNIITNMMATKDKSEVARMFQTMVSASGSSMSYPFVTDMVMNDTLVDDDEAMKINKEDRERSYAFDAAEWTDKQVQTVKSQSKMTQHELDVELAGRNPRTLQHYSRVFVVKPGTTGAVNLRRAVAKVVPDKTAAKREATGEQPAIRSRVATEILKQNGYTLRSSEIAGGATLIPRDRDVVVTKVNGIDTHWPILVVNDDLHHMDERLDQLLSDLDIETYVQMAVASYESSWRNTVPS